jgi:hypothetical protein
MGADSGWLPYMGGTIVMLAGIYAVHVCPRDSSTDDVEALESGRVTLELGQPRRDASSMGCIIE